MVDISDNTKWSQTDADNNNVAPNGFPEGMPAGSLNNAARAVMGAVKRWHDRSQPTINATGSSNAYALSYDVNPTAYVMGDVYSFIANHTNTGAATLNVASLGATTILKSDGAALDSGDIKNGDIVTVGYDGTNFQLLTVPATLKVAGGDGDKGDITVSSSGTVWSIDNDVIGTQHLADEDWGDITIASGVASIDNDVIGTQHLADEDWGDFTIASGVATIDNNAITTAKINDDAVTLAKIPDAALSGADSTLITGTSGTNNNTAKWNTDGDLVDGYPVLDEDNMSSNSNTSLATQQSIKAYVDSNTGSDFTWLSQSTGGGATSIDVTGISGAKEVVILFDLVNVDGDNEFLVQLGDSGGPEDSGYNNSRSFSNNGSSLSSSGFPVRRAAGDVSGLMTLHNPTGNKWIQGHSTVLGAGGGTKTLSSTLDRIRLQRVSSGNFQSGTVYVGYR